jgi:hypothetical protein
VAPSIILDPEALVTAGRIELSLTTDPIRVASDGPDWGTAQIQAYLSQQARGETPVDFRVPNREVRIPLTLGVTGNLETARRNLQEKVALIQREGGALEYTPSGSTNPVYLDLVDAALVWPERNVHLGYQTDVVLELTALPDFYGEEETLSEHSETSAAELIFTETNIKGDYPGRLRITVDNDEAATQRGLIASVRARHYSSAASAAVAYEAEALTALDTAAVATRSGASGGGSNNVMAHTNLATNWTPVLGTGNLTHTGTYRLWARVYTPSDDVELRFVYDVGDYVLPEENDPVTIPVKAGLCLVDLGEVRLDEVPLGTHRWSGQVQARGAIGGEDVEIDRLWFFNTDEGYCTLRAPLSATFSTYSARDEYNHSSGALTSKVAPVGGTWTVVASSDADDFSINTTSRAAQRTAVSDSALTSGRMVSAGTTNYTAIWVSGEVELSAGLSSAVIRTGVFARLTDISNYLAAVRIDQGTSTDSSHVKLAVIKRVAGTVTTLGETDELSQPSTSNQQIDLHADADGNWAAFIYPAGSARPTDPTLSGYDADLATGGTLATGKIGLIDAYTSSTALTRTHKNFAAYVPNTDAVAYASQSVELRWDGCLREDSAGTAWAPIAPTGDLLRIPPSGLEDRTVQVAIKLSRGDLQTIRDSSIDNLSATVAYRPSYLFVSEAA